MEDLTDGLMDEGRIATPAEEGLPRQLRGLSIDDLEVYQRALEAEIVRVAAEIRERQRVRGAANALFKPRPPG